MTTETQRRSQPALSVVVPLYNEEGNVAPLVTAVCAALKDAGSWELVLVDDGSTDNTAAVATAMVAVDQRVRVVPLARNFGQTAATQAGFDHARGRVVVTMDGDLQNDPVDIPRIVEALAAGHDFVVGYRERRQDRLLTRRLPSWVANRLLRWITGVNVRDHGCSLKGYRVELLRRLNLYSDMHRFVPALAAAEGARITEIPVRHHPRRFGESKYGLSRIFKVLADFITIKMIRSFRERPLRMLGIGAWTSLLLATGFGVAAQPIMHGPGGHPGAVVFVGATLLWLGLACHLLMLGLLTEVALREHHRPSDDDPFCWEGG